DALVQKGVDPSNITHIETDKDALIEKVKAILEPEDKILIKASNGMGLIEVVEALRVSSEQE
ncbi:MAG: hypothetical protein B7Z25_02385, partial [Aerococcus viridans]